MPRDFSQIQAAAQYISNSVTADETTSFPPGYISGFNVILAQDYTVTISAGAAYVAGRGVKLTEDHLLSGDDWVTPRFDSLQHYYIYLDKSGSFRVDLVAPVFNNEYCYYEQPDAGWRAIGKIFVKGNDIIYAARQVEKTGSTVTVAPAGFTGEADYYCTGVNDDILINAAILYLHQAYSGGTVNILRGDYSISSEITIGFSNISLLGADDLSSVLISTSGLSTYMVNITSTLALGNVSLSRLYIHDTRTTGGSLYIVRLNTVDNFRMESCTVEGGPTTQVWFEGANSGGIFRNNKFIGFVNGLWLYNASITSVVIEGNLFDGAGGGATGGACAILVAATSGDSLIISNNTIQNLANSAYCYGISVVFPGVIIAGNHVENIVGTGDDASKYTIGITSSGIDGVVTGNFLDTIQNTFDNTLCFGLRAGGARTVVTANKVKNCLNVGIGITGANCTIADNSCFNNGSDTGIANTNSHNFSDSGTDTQVYSNSWQSPVSGEPEQGQFHWLLTAPTAGWWVSTNATATIVSVTNSYLPVGAKSIEAFVRLSNNYSYFMTSKYPACTCTGAFMNMTAFLEFPIVVVGEEINMGSRVRIAVDANRKFYYRSWNGGASLGVAGAAVNVAPYGYTS